MSDTSRPAHGTPSPGAPSVLRRAAPIFMILAIGLIVRIPFLGRPGFQFDRTYFAWWGFATAAHGFDAPYHDADLPGLHLRRCNIPPLNLYGFWAMARLYPWVFGRAMSPRDVIAAHTGELPADAARAFAMFKIPATLADLATAIVLWQILRRRTSGRFAIVAACIYAAHPAVIYDSAVWGQVDGMHTLAMLFSIDAAIRQRPAQMTAAATLAVLAKPQAILLAPVWLGTLLFGGLPRSGRARVRRVAVSIAVALAIGAVVIGPFGFDQIMPGGGIYDAYFKSVGYYPLVHLNGFSAWFFLNPMDRPHLDALARWYIRDDRPWLAGITPRQFGFAALAAATALVFIRLYRRGSDPGSIRWAVSILSLAFFILPTQIHERYLFPAIAIWACAAAPTPRWATAWIIIGLVALVNMAWAWPGPEGGWGERIIAPLLHSSAVGIMCATALAVVFAIEVMAGPTQKPPHGT